MCSVSIGISAGQRGGAHSVNSSGVIQKVYLERYVVLYVKYQGQ